MRFANWERSATEPHRIEVVSGELLRQPDNERNALDDYERDREVRDRSGWISTPQR